MQPHVRSKLNQLNRNFYQTIAPEFVESREQPWGGWQKLLPFMDSFSPLEVWDIGCGNGRFSHFLAQHLDVKKIRYTGFDNSQALLDLKVVNQQVTCTFINFDIVEALEASYSHGLPFFSGLPTHPVVVTLFGVLHHLPSTELRATFFEKCATELPIGSLLIFTRWNFVSSPRLMAKSVLPEVVGIERTELEPGDFILSWQRGKTAYRYCHFPHHDEVAHWLNTPGLQVIEHYQDDGKERNLNDYWILKT